MAIKTFDGIEQRADGFCRPKKGVVVHMLLSEVDIVRYRDGRRWAIQISKEVQDGK